MGLFSSNNSWTNQAKGETNRTGLLPSGSWTSKTNRNDKRKECPPVRDCRVKQSLMASAKEQRLWGVKTKKEVAKAKKEAEQVAKQQKADRRARGRSGGGGWPNAGKYEPVKKKGFWG